MVISAVAGAIGEAVAAAAAGAAGRGSRQGRGGDQPRGRPAQAHRSRRGVGAARRRILRLGHQARAQGPRGARRMLFAISAFLCCFLYWPALRRTMHNNT